MAKVRSPAPLAGQRLAVIPDPEEALLGQAPASVASALAEADVVLLATGEVDPVRARLARRNDQEVDLRTAEQPDGGLVRAAVDDPVDRGQADEPFHERRRVGRLGEEVEIADRLAGGGTPGRPRRGQAGRARQLGHHPGR